MTNNEWLWGSNDVTVGKRNHKEYAILNDEWRYCNRSLSGYLDELMVSGGDLRRYEGIYGFYIRSGWYGVGYVSGGDKARLDPWYRPFVAFPGISVSGMGRMGSCLYDCEAFYCSLINNNDKNVYVISTSVHGNKLYCVDVLNGVNK